MKLKGVFLIFFAILSVNCFSQQFKRIPLHYSLVGESNGIKVEILLDRFIPKYEQYLSDPSDPSSTFTDDYVAKNVSTFFSPIDFVMINNSDRNLDLSATVDSLIIATAQQQIEFSFLSSSPEYPQRLLKKATLKSNISSPFDLNSILSSPDQQKKAMSISATLVSLDQALQSVKLKATSDADFQARIEKLEKWANENSIIYGGYLISIHNVDIPLTLHVYM